MASEKDGPAAIVRDRFIKQRSQGKPFRELSDRAKKERALQGFPPNKPILIRSGKLFRAATSGKVFIRNNKFVLPFKDSAAPKYKGRKKVRVNISAYAFSPRIYKGREFFAAPTATEASRIKSYIGGNYVSIITSVFNNKKPSVSSF